MNKKTIIQVIVIIVAFSTAGIVLYNGLFKGGEQTIYENIAVTEQKDQGTLLPYGNTLDFTVLKKQDLFYNQVSYPKLDPNSEIGIPLENLIISPYTTK